MAASKSKTVNLQPSWESTMHMLILLLQDGSPAGKAMAKHELLTIGRQMDDMLPGNAPKLNPITEPARVRS